jgi:hypothetical protein
LVRHRLSLCFPGAQIDQFSTSDTARTSISPIALATVCEGGHHGAPAVQFSLFLLFFPQLSATVCFYSAEILSFARLRGRRNSKAVGSFAAVSPRFWANCPNTGTCSMKGRPG